MKLNSTAFTEGGMIPQKYTCDGQNISPPLAWSDVPAGAKSLALICDDPDAPVGTWVHWVLFNLPPGLKGLPEGVPADPAPKIGGLHGTNSWRQIGYGGPCPPSGSHRYYCQAVCTGYAAQPGKQRDGRRRTGRIEGACVG